MIPSLPNEVLDRIREQLHKRNKIMAVKLYREATGLGLAESLQAVEAIAAGVRPLSAVAPQVVQAVVAQVKHISEHEHWPRIREELLRGNNVEAIKLFRDAMGVSLIEAKRGVEAEIDKLFAEGNRNPQPVAPPPLPATPPPPTRPALTPMTSAPPAAESPAITLNDAWTRIRSELLRGNKLEAIRIYRESHRVGLAEAKKIVESYCTSLTGKPTVVPRARASSRMFAIGYFLLAIGSFLAGLNAAADASQRGALPWLLWFTAACFTGAGISALRARTRDGEN